MCVRTRSRVRTKKSAKRNFGIRRLGTYAVPWPSGFLLSQADGGSRWFPWGFHRMENDENLGSSPSGKSWKFGYFTMEKYGKMMIQMFILALQCLMRTVILNGEKSQTMGKRKCKWMGNPWRSHSARWLGIWQEDGQDMVELQWNTMGIDGNRRWWIPPGPFGVTKNMSSLHGKNWGGIQNMVDPMACSPLLGMVYDMNIFV